LSSSQGRIALKAARQVEELTVGHEGLKRDDFPHPRPDGGQGGSRRIGGAVTGCYGCANFVWVYAAAPTHVIIDVMGYYTEATGFAGGAVTWLIGPWGTYSIGAGSTDWNDGGSCPAGTVILGGGANSSGPAC
jgi:hypothetical protein